MYKISVEGKISIFVPLTQKPDYEIGQSGSLGYFN